MCRFDPCYPHHVGMDCAPFKKPGRLAGLFSYRSVIPPSPHRILLTQTSVGAPAARRAANTQAVHRLRRLILSHRRARSAAAPSPHKILLEQTFAGTLAALRAAYRLCSIQKARPVGRAFLISLRHSISAQEPPLTRRLASKRACGRSPSPHGILPVQTSAGNLSVRSALASPAMEYRDYQRNRERNCHLHCFSSYRSFVFILSSSSFSCFSD